MDTHSEGFLNIDTDLSKIKASVLIVGVGPQTDGVAAHNTILHLVEEYDATQIGTINSEDLFDLSDERPQVSLDDLGNRTIEWPDASFWHLAKENLSSSVVAPLVDTRDGDILFFTSPEPHFKWMKIAEAITHVATKTQIQKIILLSSFDGPVPYDKQAPILVTSGASANDAENPAHDFARNIADLTAASFTTPKYQGGATFTMALGTMLRNEGFMVATINAIAPFYVQNSGSPHAIDALLSAFDSLYGTITPRYDLEEEMLNLRTRLENARSEDSTFDTFINALDSQFLTWQQNFVQTVKEPELKTEDILADVEALFNEDQVS
mgnify:CR=1 FL=1|jgi:predicted ATP-grasp superfamily ATP-dependent carboligase